MSLAKLFNFTKLSLAEFTLGLVLGLVIGLGSVYIWQFSQNYEVVIQPPGIGTNYILEYGSYPEMADREFFDGVKEQFIENQTSFVEADLSEMIMRVYSQGKLAFEGSIAAKGREGSWWETPAGLYQVQGKSPNHFSSLASVYMPWSIHFHGNFFIHGWPYHPGGREVVSAFSGGCIRLRNDDAKSVYDLVKVGMPVLVHENRTQDNGETYQPHPPVSAKSFMVTDLNSNFVFFDQNSDETIPMGSMVHLLSALVAVEHISLNSSTHVQITANMLGESPRPRLRSGERLTLYDLLFPLLMERSNEAGQAVANIRGSNLFIRWLNDKAQALGMEETRIETAIFSGDQQNQNLSSAADLLKLLHHIYHNRRFVLNISALPDGASGWNSAAFGRPAWSDLENLNPAVGLSSFLGGTSSDQSGRQSLAIVMELEIDQQKRPVAFVIIDSADALKDLELLKKAVQAFYSIKTDPDSETLERSQRN